MFVDKGRMALTFAEGKFIYLKVPTKSKTLKTVKCGKLFPRYYGPSKVLKKVGGLAYKLELAEQLSSSPYLPHQ